MTAPIRIGDRHCCVCNRICHHIGGPWFCDEHKAQAAAITPQLAPARADEAFRRRLAERMQDDDALLARLGDKPCPSRFAAVLGFPATTVIPCGLVEGHRGRHCYFAEWADESDRSLPIGGVS